jgi:hypothetical protein
LSGVSEVIELEGCLLGRLLGRELDLLLEALVEENELLWLGELEISLPDDKEETEEEALEELSVAGGIFLVVLVEAVTGVEAFAVLLFLLFGVILLFETVPRGEGSCELWELKRVLFPVPLPCLDREPLCKQTNESGWNGKLGNKSASNVNPLIIVRYSQPINKKDI